MASPQRLEHTVLVHVPIQTAYNQWTQFESFPAFMEGVEEVRQLDDTHLHWRASLGGKTVAWNAEIVKQVPDQLIVWRSTTGAINRGEVHFTSQGIAQTQVRLVIDYAPQGIFESLGGALGSVDRRIRSDLERFKAFIERQGAETGAWRGTVVAGSVQPELVERWNAPIAEEQPRTVEPKRHDPSREPLRGEPGRDDVRDPLRDL